MKCTTGIVRPFARAAALAVATLALALGTVASAALLVGNVGQARLDATVLGTLDLAQSFTTGDNLAGYTLTGIDLRLETSGSNRARPTVKVVRGSANGTVVATLNSPSSLDANTAKTYTFTRFDSVPDDHDGSSAIKFELHFSREPQGLSYKTVGGALLEVTGGTITGARRLTPRDNSGWEVSAQQSGNDDVVIRLPNRACDEANAVCIGGQPLAAEVSTTIPREGREEPTEPLAPFTAAFAGRVPTEHDGAASTKLEFEFHLSHNPGHLSYLTVRDDLFTVTGGTIENAWRLTQGDEKHMHWGIRVDPDGVGDVTVTLKATTNCAGTPGVCRLSDNAMLSSYLRQVIKGPASLSVADATVAEDQDATLDFVVTLSRTRFGSTTVQYATSDGTATSGSDYTATSGTLTFGFNETSTKTGSTGNGAGAGRSGWLRERRARAGRSPSPRVGGRRAGAWTASGGGRPWRAWRPRGLAPRRGVG